MILLQSPKGSFIFFDYAVVFLAVIANCIVLSAVIGGRFGLSGYRRFLISLTVSDLYICLVNILTFAYQIWMLCSATSSAEKCGANFLRALQLAGFFANLLNLCGMSVDHFFGIVYPMQYRYLMSKKVARMAVIFIWIISFALAFLDFPVNMILYKNFVSASEQANARLDSSLHSVQGGGGLYSSSEYASHRNYSIPTGGLTKLTFGPTTFGYPGPGGTTLDILLSSLPYLNQRVDKVKSNKNAKRSKKQYQTFGSTFPLVDSSPGTPQSKRPSTSDYYYQQATSPGDVILPGYEDDGKSNGDMSLDTADIEAFLESMINPENALDINIFDNDTNTTNPLNRILIVLQAENQNVDWCTFFSANKMWLEVCVMVLTLLCFAFLTICYGIIFKKVADSADTSGRSTNKLVVTTIILLGAFCICWLPFMTFETAMLLIFQYDRDAKSHQTKSFLVNFFFLHNMFNSLLMTYPFVDPIIYAVRVPAVQRYIVITYCKFFPCFRPCVGRLNSRQHSLGTSAPRMTTVQSGLPPPSESGGDDINNKGNGNLAIRRKTNATNSFSRTATPCHHHVVSSPSETTRLTNHVRLDDYQLNHHTNGNIYHNSTAQVKRSLFAARKSISVTNSISNNKAVGATLTVNNNNDDSISIGATARNKIIRRLSTLYPASFATNIRRSSLTTGDESNNRNDSRTSTYYYGQGVDQQSLKGTAGLCLFCIAAGTESKHSSVVEMEAISASTSVKNKTKKCKKAAKEDIEHEKQEKNSFVAVVGNGTISEERRESDITLMAKLIDDGKESRRTSVKNEVTNNVISSHPVLPGNNIIGRRHSLTFTDKEVATTTRDLNNIILFDDNDDDSIAYTIDI